MPELEAVTEIPDVVCNKTSVVEADLVTSESESNALSEDYQMSLANSLISSMESDDIILESESVNAFNEALDTPMSFPACSSLPDDNFLLPIEYNLRQLLIKVTETEDLESVTSLRLRVVARDFSLQRLPFFLPRLRKLNLDGSCLMTLRDLGCGMQSLTVLQVSRTGLKSLDGLLGLPGLVELRASSNYIRELCSCASLRRLEFLDISKNKIVDINKVAFLELCPVLKHLYLEGNSCCEDVGQDYRKIVKEIVPNLLTLDGTNFQGRSPISPEPGPSTRIISRFPPLPQRNLKKEQEHNRGFLEDKKIQKNPFDRPHTTNEIIQKSSKDLKLLPIRPSTAQEFTSHNDFAFIIEGSNLKLRNPSRLTSGRPVSGSLALKLWEYRKLKGKKN